MWWLIDQYCGADGAHALASMLLMHVPLTTLDLSRMINTLLLLNQNSKRFKLCEIKATRSMKKEHVH